MSIQYPAFLENKLSTNRELRSAVDGTVADFDHWLKDSKLPFFPDYTDHGPEHLSQVLATASELLSEEASSLFTAGDAAVLILATLLHDSAMHLSEAGFQELIVGHARDSRIPAFDSEAWPDKWQDFLFAAKRWDDQELIEVFGVSPSGHPRATVRDPFKYYDNLADSDRKLIGEFIRRDHHRMAHEFAVFGVPGPTGDPISPDTRFGDELCDIAGLVARSHGMPVRTCVDYLSREYHRREFQGVHGVFLMALLRVADYLQIQPDRSSSLVFRYKHIPSRTSVQEHKAHQAIKNITQTHDDPESIEIQAHPEDVGTFLRLSEWLSGIQAELDGSWAVLGEVYGSHRGLRNLGLVIRRVRSNLHDVESFARRVDYVPQRVEFDVAHAEMLKLLIRPLYGSCPEIGIRELVQNAVDAVRERIKFQEHHPEFADNDMLDQQPDVMVWIDDDDDEDGHCLLTVRDRGIGMTPEVIRDFFLKIGASYRKSQSWQREFEADQEGDESPQAIKSQVLRSGRFGIGALAVFLLGKQIEVETRHVNASNGIRFKTTLDRRPIQLDYRSGLPVGTTVRVRIPVEVSRRLRESGWREPEDANWDWYCLQTPSVQRLRGTSKQEVPQNWSLPDVDGPLPSDWRSTSVTGLQAIHWTYSSNPELVCNGIQVIDSEEGHAVRRKHTWTSWQSNPLYDFGGYCLRVPNLSVFDPDGSLPLNLQRTQLDRDQFREALEAVLSDVIKDLLAFLLVHAKTMRDLASLFDSPLYPGLSSGRGYQTSAWPWIATEDGISVADGWVIQQLNPTRVFHIVADAESNRDIDHRTKIPLARCRRL